MTLNKITIQQERMSDSWEKR